MALGVIVAPVIADELFGVITNVDVESKKLTVQSKGGDETVVTTKATRRSSSARREPRKLDLEKLATNVKKDQDAGKKGGFAKITHEKGVASRIGVFAKKKEAPKDR